MASAFKYRWQRKDGARREAWRAQWVGADGRQQQRRGFDRKVDAMAYAADREAEARHGVTLEGERPSGRTTVKSWANTWLDAQDVRGSTRASYARCVKRIEDTLGSRTLASLRPSELKAWRRSLGQRLADSTVAHNASILSMILNAAVHDGLLDRNPMPTARGSATGRRVVDPDELLTLDQVRAWDAALPAHARGMAVVAATTGLRQGELLGLLPGDVDFLRGTARVWQQLLTPRGSGPVYGPPKTGASVRTVPLPQVAVDALAAYLAAFPAVEGEPIFRNARGGRWRRDTFGQCWQHAKQRVQRAAKQARADGVKEPMDLPEWAHWHGLRDVAASSLIWTGNDVRTVMAILGHSSPKETLGTYTRLWPDAQDTARKALDGLWSAVPERHGNATEG